MARTRTLSDLRGDAYRLADQEGATNRFPTADVTRLVNQGIAWVWRTLVDVRGLAYYGMPYWTIGSVSSSGTTPPTVSVSGIPRVGAQSSYSLVLDIVTGGSRGTATFRWSTDGGTTWQSTLTTGVTVKLPGSGLTATFATGTYNADNQYTATGSKPTLTVDQSAYALPSDFYKLHGVILTSTSDQIITLERLAELDEGMMRDSVLNPSGMPVYYTIRAGNQDSSSGIIEYLPAPQYAYTVTLTYVPTPPELSDDTETFDGIAGFEESVASYAARRMAMKNADYDLADRLDADLREWERLLRSQASDRDVGRPMRVQDVRTVARYTRLRRWR